MKSDQDLQKVLGTDDISVTPLSGGCINAVALVEAQGHPSMVAKFSDRSTLEEESIGLAALAATDTVRVPEVIAVHGSGSNGILLLEYLPSGAVSDWAAFGRALGALHEKDVGDQYGFDCDNHLGSTPQKNGWLDDWRIFNRERRHGPLVSQLQSRGMLNGRLLTLVEDAIAAFDDVLPAHPKPALLHGDLWSGNALGLADGSVAVIDPAPSVGDGLADIAMMQLFGGFPKACFQAYADYRGLEFIDAEMAVYRLYHMLNHMVIFGNGYQGGVEHEASLIRGAV